MLIRNPDTNLIKKTHHKLIISGSFIELYNYQRPQYYNFSPLEKKPSSQSQTDRRKDSIYRTKNNINRLINTNQKQKQVPKFITFTFEKNITNIKQANKQWSVFIRRLRNHYPNIKIKYITVIEFQKRGAIHYHTIFFNLPYTKNLKHIIRNYWQQGFIKIKAVKHVKNLGLYLSKYLTKDTFDNRLIKQKAYFTSRNLEKPIIYRDEKNVENFLNHSKLMLLSTYEYKSPTLGKVLINKYNL